MARFKQEEKEYILTFCVSKKDVEVLKDFKKVFGRELSLYSLRQLRRRLGLKKTGGRGICRVKGRIPQANLSMWLFGVTQ